MVPNRRNPYRAGGSSKTNINLAHYLCYVPDEESPQEIQRRFEELEQYQQQVQQTGELVEEDMIMLYKKTNNPKNLFLEELDEEIEIEPKAVIVDYISDSGSDSVSNGVSEEEDPLEKESVVSLLPNFSPVMKRKRKSYNYKPVGEFKLPDQRLPKEIPVFLAPQIILKERETSVEPNRHFVSAITKNIWQATGKSFLALYADPPFRERPGEKKITIEEFRDLALHKITKGFLFVWTEKEITTQLVFIVCRSWGMRYVETISWVKLLPDSSLSDRPGCFFHTAKRTLMVFRHNNDIELRHQRNCDSVFGYVDDNNPNEDKKPESIYTTIETLLPCSFPTQRCDRLLELWAGENKRQGWTQVAAPKE